MTSRKTLRATLLRVLTSLPEITLPAIVASIDSELSNITRMLGLTPGARYSGYWARLNAGAATAAPN